MSGDWLNVTEGTVYLLDIKERKGYCLPEIVSIFTSDFEMLVPLLLDQGVVLDCHCVPHEVFLKNRAKCSDFFQEKK